jgi:hypothetical protein
MISCFKKFYIVFNFIFILFLTGCSFDSNTNQEKNVDLSKKTQFSGSQLNKKKNLKIDKKEKKFEYDIFGGEEFSTLVKGYLKIKQQEIFSNNYDIAYLVITEYEDEGFIKSIKKGIKEGNSVNSISSDGEYMFNLGCLKNNKITGRQYEKDPYLDQRTEQKILNSVKDNPVKLKLFFSFHDGAACVCCNLAHLIRLVE